MGQEAQQVWCDVKQNEAMMSALLPIKESFDLICRELQIGEREAAFYFVDGMIKDEAMVKILGQLLGITKEKMPEDATGFSRCCMPYVEVDIYDDFDTVVRNVLSGAIALFIDGYEACIVLDCRTYPARSVEEPAQDKSLRGSRDGFVETIVFDTALIRRRIRDPQLVMEMLEVGTSSRSDVVLCYMKNLAKPELGRKSAKKNTGGRDTGSVHESAESGGGTDRYALVQPIPEIQIYRASGYGSGMCDGREGRHSRGQCAFRNDPSDLDF